LGVRQASDADLIATIANTPRKLIGEGTDARAAGFFFSLGHAALAALSIWTALRLWI
jgi:high-affinity nickel-transport protein